MCKWVDNDDASAQNCVVLFTLLHVVILQTKCFSFSFITRVHTHTNYLNLNTRESVCKLSN
jgi:hypothetical protein